MGKNSNISDEDILKEETQPGVVVYRSNVPRTMGYQVGWICGDENTKVCTGCFWYDIEKFNHEVSKGFVKTA